MATGIEMWEERGSERRCRPRVFMLVTRSLLSLWAEVGQHEVLGDTGEEARLRDLGCVRFSP